MTKRTKAKTKKKNEIIKPKEKNKKENKDKNIQKITKLDPKLSVDKYFPDRKNYHLCKDTKTRDSASYESCTMYYIDNRSHKFYNIQLLEHDTRKDLKLFTRWGKIDSKGSQEIKTVPNYITGNKLFLKKCQQKINKGYREVFIAPEPDLESEINKNNNTIEDKVKKVKEIINNLSKTEAYEIKYENINPNITDSKIGGLPYWPKNKEYPVNMSNTKLALLIQINFDKEKTEYPLPKEGMLQIFLLPYDDILGANLDYNEDLTEQKNFRVIYHDKIDYSITKEQIKKLKLPTHENDKLDFPVKKETKVSLQKKVDKIVRKDFRFEKYFAKAYKEVFKKNMPKDFNIDEFLEGDDRDDEDESENDVIHDKMLGYPHFIQRDPRTNDNYEYEVYDTVLLYLVSQEDLLIWGDLGLANFLIQKKDLINKKFDDVLYYWDCY